MQLNPNAAAITITGPLTIGSRGQDVRTLQDALNLAIPSLRLQPDGAFGLKTDGAVRVFQRSKNLKSDGIVGPRTAGALGLRYKARAQSAPLSPLGLQTPQGPRAPHETPVLPGPPADSAIAQLVEAVIQGWTQIQNGVLQIVSALEDLPDLAVNEIRGLLSSRFQTAIGVLRNCVHVAAADVVSAAKIVGSAIRGASQWVIGALQACLGVLARLPDFLGLTGITDQIRSIIARLQRAVEGVIDVVLRTLSGVGRTLFEAVAAILGILRDATPI